MGVGNQVLWGSGQAALGGAGWSLCPGPWMVLEKLVFGGSGRTCIYPRSLAWLSQCCLFLYRTDGGYLSPSTRLQPSFLPRRNSLSNRLQPPACSKGTGVWRETPREAAEVCLRDPCAGPWPPDYTGL